METGRKWGGKQRKAKKKMRREGKRKKMTRGK